MRPPAPHFLLFSESRRRSAKSPPSDWRFVLQSLDGKSRLEAADAEPALGGERLELLAVVRGLEALEQPSQVTLVTTSKYVARGLSYGLSDWRENDWNWEHHGQMVPIKNRDLWQRLDRALAYHRVQCRTAPVDEPKNGGSQAGAVEVNRQAANPPPAVPAAACGGAPMSSRLQPTRSNRLAEVWASLIATVRRWLERWSEIEAPAGRWRIS